MTYGTCQVARAGQELHFFPPLPPPPEPQATLLPVGNMESPAGWRLIACSLSEPQPDRRSVSPALIWLDQDRVAFPLSLRSVLPGDRFWPEGAGCQKDAGFPGGCQDSPVAAAASACSG